MALRVCFTRKTFVAGLALCAPVLLAACGSDSTPQPTSGVGPNALPTPYPTVRIELLSPNGLVETRATEIPASLNMVSDGTFCSPAWQAGELPASISLPVGAVSGDLLLEWNSGRTTDYMSPPDAPVYGIPSDYVIATSKDSTDGTDGTWSTVVTVADNSARTRAHRIPFAGAKWVRLTVTGVVKGPLGDTVVIDEIELHDATSGTEDTVFFLGDSITADAFSRCPATQPSFAERVRSAYPQRFPAMIDGGVSSVNSSYGVSKIEDLLALNPDFHVWAIGYGTNDAWQKTPPATYDERLQAIVDAVKKGGRMPVIARIPFAAKGPNDADIEALNKVVDLVTTRNGLLPGPDLYAWFKAHPDELADGVHPTDAGASSINRLWFEALRPMYDAKP